MNESYTSLLLNFPRTISIVQIAEYNASVDPLKLDKQMLLALLEGTCNLLPFLLV